MKDHRIVLVCLGFMQEISLFLMLFLLQFRQVCAFTAQTVRKRDASRHPPLAEGDLSWADAVTGRPKAELLPADQGNCCEGGLNSYLGFLKYTEGVRV